MLRLLRWLVLLVAVSLSTATAHAQQFTVPSSPEPDPTWEVRDLPDQWITVRGAAFDIHGHIDHMPVLDRLIAHGDKALPKLASDLGVGIGNTIHVYVADSMETFRTMQPGEPPEWADGTAWPSLGVIFLRHPTLRKLNDRPLEQVLDHELVHVLLGRAFAPQPTPRWLQEGVAQVYSGEVGPDLPQRLARGMVGREPYSLDTLTRGFPSTPMGADLAYAQSADFIQWLRAEHGEDAIRRLIRDTSAGRPFPSTVVAITGSSLQVLDETWRRRLRASTPVWTSPETLMNALWGSAGLALLVVGFFRRRALTQRLSDWREQDDALAQIARTLLSRRG